jgi:hypothetical protein
MARIRLQTMVQHPRALERTPRQIQIRDRGAAATAPTQTQQLRKHIRHGAGVLVALAPLLRHKARV